MKAINILILFFVCLSLTACDQLDLNQNTQTIPVATNQAIETIIPTNTFTPEKPTITPTQSLPTQTKQPTTNYIIIPHSQDMIGDLCAPGWIVPAGIVYFEDHHGCPGNTDEECHYKLRDYVPKVTIDDLPISVVPNSTLQNGNPVGSNGLTDILEQGNTKGKWALFSANLEPGTYAVRSFWPIFDGSDGMEKSCTLVVSAPD